MRRGIRDVYWFNSPLYTLRALVWNIRALGFAWWLYCLARNVCATMRERLGAPLRGYSCGRYAVVAARDRN